MWELYQPHRYKHTLTEVNNTVPKPLKLEFLLKRPLPSYHYSPPKVGLASSPVVIHTSNYNINNNHNNCNENINNNNDDEIK